MRGLFIILSLFPLQALAQAAPPVVTWEKCLGGTYSDDASNVRRTPDGGYITAGKTYSNDGDVSGNHGYFDGWVVKLDSSANIQWQKCYGGHLTETILNITPTNDGGYIFIGSATYGNSGDLPAPKGKRDIWVVKLNSTGDIQWSKFYGGAEEDLGYWIEQTNDNGFIFCGSTTSNGDDVSGKHPGEDAWVVKLDPAGNIQWQKCYGGSDEDYATCLIKTADGGYAFAGTTFSEDGDLAGFTTIFQSGWVVKIDASGNIIWSKGYGGNTYDFFRGICQAADGGYIVNGQAGVPRTPGWPQGYGEWLVTKLSATGAVEWERSFGGSEDEYLSGVKTTSDNGILAWGNTKSVDGSVCKNHGYYDGWIMKLNSDGSTVWQETLGGSLNDHVAGIFEQADGNYMVFANSASSDGTMHCNHSVDYDIWIAKLSFPGIPIYPTFSINTTTLPVCEGKEVLFRSVKTKQGTHPVYDWFVNGAKVPGKADSIRLYSLNNGDVVHAVLTSSDACVTHPVVQSNPIPVTINPSVTATITIAADDTTICEGQNTNFAATITHGGTSPVYNWNINNNPQPVNAPVFSPGQLKDNDSVQCILRTDAFCATDSIVSSNIIKMSVGRKPSILLKTDTTIFAGDAFQLNPVITGTISSYLWTPSAGLSNNTIPSPLASPAVTTTYKLVVTSVNDCGTEEASISVRVLRPIVVPNAFSPNGDNINDQWNIRHLTDYPGATVEVFNRAGQRVFSSTNYNAPWNGKLNGNRLPPGNYYYLIDPKNGLKIIAGSLLIL